MNNLLFLKCWKKIKNFYFSAPGIIFIVILSDFNGCLEVIFINCIFDSAHLKIWTTRTYAAWWAFCTFDKTLANKVKLNGFDEFLTILVHLNLYGVS